MFLSGTGIAYDHNAVTGHHLTTHQIAEAWAAADSEASATMLRFEGRLARALAAMVNLLDPDIIVIGGGVSRIPASTPISQRSSVPGSSAATSTPPSSPLNTATPAESEAQPGSGPPDSS